MNAETLVGNTPNLRAPSPTVLRLLNLLNDPDTDYDEVIRTVAKDVVLSTKLLALCNSAVYGLSKPVASLKQAVQYLGYCETLRMVMALNFGGQIGGDLPGYGQSSGELWRHSLLTALSAPHVSGLSGRISVDNSIAYTAGLIHDIGKIVISQNLDAKLCRHLQELVERGEATLLDAEREVMGVDHAEVGACLLRKWRIPEVIVEAAEFHHAPPLSDGPKLSAVVHVAEWIAHSGEEHSAHADEASPILSTVLDALRLSKHHLKTISEAAAQSAEKIAQQERSTGCGEPAAGAAACAFS